MAEVDGGRLVAKMLKQEGVEYIFTLSGDVWPIYGGCWEEGIKVIDFRHEQTATHAAEGWAKATGKPGVATVVRGPGLTNAVTAVTNAFLSPSPIILFTARNPISEWERGSLQEMDAVEILRPVTKWAKLVVEQNRVPEYVSMAFRHATSGKPGPTLLEIPTDILGETIDDSEVEFPTKYRTEGRPEGDPLLVKEAANLLAKAHNPVVLAGGMVWWSQAADALHEFLQTGGFPVYLNGMARGSISPDYPLCFGQSRNFALGQADVVLAIGVRLDFRLGFGRSPIFHPEAKVIQVDVDPADIGHNRPIEVGIAGDIRSILQQLNRELCNSFDISPKTSWIETLCNEEVRRQEEAEPLLNSDAVPIHPMRLCKEIRDFLDMDSTVVGDGGHVVTLGSRVIKVHYPGHWMDPGPMGTLGVGAGFAIATKLARPHEQVLLLSGDGSFGMWAMELDTMVRHNIPVVTVVGNNAVWLMAGQAPEGRPDRELARNLLDKTRYDKVAESLGCHGEYVERPEEIRPALERAFASGLPACVNVITDPEVRAERRTRATEEPAAETETK